MSDADVKLDEGLTLDEKQRISRHEEIKGQVRDEVHDQIHKTIDNSRADDEENVGAVAREMRQKALREVNETEREIGRGKTAARTAQIIDYVFYVIYGLIGLEILLMMIGARDRGFKSFLDALTRPLLGPFRGILPDLSIGRIRVAFSFGLALVVYFFLQRAIRGLLRLMVQRQTRV